MSPYREARPHVLLAPFVDCYWSSAEISAVGSTFRVLPDGCLDLLFERASPNGSFIGAIVGAMTRPLVVVGDGRFVEHVAIRFRPGCAYSFLGIAAGELTDDKVEADLPRLAEELAACRTFAARATILDRFLLDRLALAAARRDARVDHAVDEIWRSGGSLRIDDLARELAVSRQYLARQFRLHVGLSPKLLSRVARFRLALARLAMQPCTPGATLAADLGYADQAHMIAEFREFAARTPTSLAR